MNWLYLFWAGIMEIGWPLGFKMANSAQSDSGRYLWIAFSIFSMALSGILLYLAQRNISMGTAYLVWTGIGGLGTFIVGILLFNDPASIVRYLGALLVFAGIVLLRFN